MIVIVAVVVVAIVVTVTHASVAIAFSMASEFPEAARHRLPVWQSRRISMDTAAQSSATGDQARIAACPSHNAAIGSSPRRFV